MTIPEIRYQMHLMAHRVGGAEGIYLHWLADQTRRRPPVRRASPRRLTPSKAQVLAFFKRHPDADYQACANALATNTGRISEKLRGKRH